MQNSILKAVVISLDVFESSIIDEKNFGTTEVEDVKKWWSKYDTGNNVCICYEMQNNIKCN